MVRHRRLLRRTALAVAASTNKKRQRTHPPLRRHESTNLAAYTANAVRAIEKRINNMPRRSQHWSTAHDVFAAGVAMTS